MTQYSSYCFFFFHIFFHSKLTIRPVIFYFLPDATVEVEHQPPSVETPGGRRNDIIIDKVSSFKCPARFPFIERQTVYIDTRHYIRVSTGNVYTHYTYTGYKTKYSIKNLIINYYTKYLYNIHLINAVLKKKKKKSRRTKIPNLKVLLTLRIRTKYVPSNCTLVLSMYMFTIGFVKYSSKYI